VKNGLPVQANKRKRFTRFPCAERVKPPEIVVQLRHFVRGTLIRGRGFQTPFQPFRKSNVPMRYMPDPPRSSKLAN
jgi:hypothetical protein